MRVQREGQRTREDLEKLSCFPWERLTNLHLSRTCEQEVIWAMENSSYFESLEVKAKERYLEKLSCVGLSIQDDP